MFTMFRKGLLGMGLALTGCATATAPQSALVPGPQGVTCSKCQVTYVSVPNKIGKQIVGYNTQGVMECPDCKDAVTNFFTTGKLQHTCKTCGDSMSICEAHS